MRLRCPCAIGLPGRTSRQPATTTCHSSASCWEVPRRADPDHGDQGAGRGLAQDVGALRPADSCRRGQTSVRVRDALSRRGSMTTWSERERLVRRLNSTDSLRSCGEVRFSPVERSSTDRVALHCRSGAAGSGSFELQPGLARRSPQDGGRRRVSSYIAGGVGTTGRPECSSFESPSQMR